MEAGDRVSVYADVDGTCRKGLLKPFDGRVVYVGNGVAEMSRSELFSSDEPPRYKFYIFAKEGAVPMSYSCIRMLHS